MKTISKILTSKVATLVFYAFGGFIAAAGGFTVGLIIVVDFILAIRDYFPGVF